MEAVLHAMKGDFDIARELVFRGRQRPLELGQRVSYAAMAQVAAKIELMAADPPAAEAVLREGRDILVAAGNRGYLSTVAAVLAQALALQGKLDEAETAADEAAAAGAEDDWVTQLQLRVARAHIAEGRGNLAEARRIAGEVLARGLYDTVDTPMAMVAVADLLEPEARRAALEQALAGAEEKGNVVTAEQARAKLAALP
jgi:ATP/maltotriose-dependent transcriptional regulator MalT